MKTNIKLYYFYFLLMLSILTLSKSVEAAAFSIGMAITFLASAAIGAGSTALGAYVAGGKNSADGNSMHSNIFNNNGDQTVNINPGATPSQAALDLLLVSGICGIGSIMGWQACDFKDRLYNNSNAQDFNNIPRKRSIYDTEIDFEEGTHLSNKPDSSLKQKL